MTKYFCDICHKEITIQNRVDVSGWHIQNSAYCVDCFQNQKNWKTIHSNLIKQKDLKSARIM